MDKENAAKKNADVLFFVLDGQTRNTASMVEVAQLAITSKERLAVVMTPYPPNLKMNDETISTT